jgi:hypothetical protein
VKRVARTIVVIAAGGALLSGCGGSSPLGSMSDAQRDQLAAAWTARIAATDGAAIPVEERNARVTALYKACAGLDQSNPLTAAVAGSCQPTAIATKLNAVLPDRCKRPTASCVRAADRLASVTEQRATAVEGLSNAASSAIEDRACRAEFAVTGGQLEAYADLAQAYRILATGAEQKDTDIAGLGQRRVDDSLAVLAPKGTVAERTARFREVCGLD